VQVHQQVTWNNLRYVFTHRIQSSRIPKKTSDKAVCAVSLFGEWRATRNLRCVEDALNFDVYINIPFVQMSEADLIYSLPRFICEIKKKNGDDYPPETLRQIVASLQKFMEMNGRVEKFMFDVKYKVIQDTLDGIMKARARAGMSLNKRQAAVITEEMENVLWNCGLLRDSSPQLY